MAKMSDAQVPSFLMTETAAASIGTPAAGKRRLFFDTDNLLYSKDEAGAVTAVAGSGGIPATILDAKGDLIAASAADTAAKLTAGANGKVLIAASGETTGLKWDFPPGYELGYDEKTSDSNITSTNSASPDTVIAASAITFDGAPVIVEFFSTRVDTGGSAISTLFYLMEGATNMGRIGALQTRSTSGSEFVTVLLRRRFTPSAGSHTYSIKAIVSSGSSLVNGGAGGNASTHLPMYIRFTKV